MQQITQGDQIKMISSNATTQHVHEQYGTVLDVDPEGRTLRVSTEAGPVLRWMVDSDNTQVVKAATSIPDNQTVPGSDRTSITARLR